MTLTAEKDVAPTFSASLRRYPRGSVESFHRHSNTGIVWADADLGAGMVPPATASLATMQMTGPPAVFATSSEAHSRVVPRSMVQVDNMLRLQDGWLGEGSVAPSLAAISRAMQALLIDAFPADVIVVPTVKGTVALEASRGTIELTVDIRDASHVTFIVDDSREDACSVSERLFDATEITEFFRCGTRD